MNQPALDFGEEFDDGSDPTYSVGELAVAVNDALRRGFRDGVWVRGEITGWSDRGKHAYFTLADDGDDTAVVNVQFFANARMRLRPMLQRHRLRLADGMKVRIFGYLDFYAPTGRLGLKMTGIDPRYTLGDIAQARQQVLQRLVADGLLDRNGRIPLGVLPLRVGVVTSVGSAAWHDFHHELAASGFAFDLSVIDARVQGDTAVSMVAASVTTLARRDLDAIVVIRGGGARNELAVFDAEAIARAIATSPVPVLTGLGHEVDRSVADEVAHTAAKTPTACAGVLTARVAAACAGAEEAWRHICYRSHAVLTGDASALAQRAQRIARRTHAALERADERIGVRTERLARAAPIAVERAEHGITTRARRLAGLGPERLARAEERLERAAERVRESPRRHLERASGRLDVLAATVAALDPAVQLRRGWTITRAGDGTIIRSIDDVAAGQEITTVTVDGSIASTVSSTAHETTAEPAVAPAARPGRETDHTGTTHDDS